MNGSACTSPYVSKPAGGDLHTTATLWCCLLIAEVTELSVSEVIILDNQCQLTFYFFSPAAIISWWRWFIPLALLADSSVSFKVLPRTIVSRGHRVVKRGSVSKFTLTATPISTNCQTMCPSEAEICVSAALLCSGVPPLSRVGLVHTRQQRWTSTLHTLAVARGHAL